MNNPSSLFVGLGSPHGDDQVGWLVADRLADPGTLPARLSIRKAAIPLDVLDWLDGVSFLGLCDASQTSAQAGSLERWEWISSRENTAPTGDLLSALERCRACGSHDFGLPEVLDLAGRLNRSPGRIVIWTISAKQYEAGQPLSEELRRNLPSICDQIRAELF